MMAQAFNPGTLDAEPDRSLSLRTAWSTQLVLGQLRFHLEILPHKLIPNICHKPEYRLDSDWVPGIELRSSSA